ncbi:MAG: alpha/beta hydrolase [Gammaproteobacteria bacterium]|uniref:alpha/beta fold hydrolase n=1 Tax=Nevskia sp. TaxID=1929292 RepID=UPI004036DAA3|nr:alpha/beta hydrolase [Gammaproteobacteria bacterium]
MSPVQFAAIDHRGRELSIEYLWIDAEDCDAPMLVFLHEGLGSVAMWRDFPARLCAASGCRGLVYSRPGYGRSTPRRADERWPPDFLERQAREVLPAFLDAVGVDPHAQPLILFGHSDGGSIALIAAGEPAAAWAGVIVMAPHLLAEDLSLTSIRAIRDSYRSSDLRSRLARFHDDPDSAFYGWNDVWLDADFATFSLEAAVSRIRCAVLAIQGVDDEYGTMAQIDAIAARVADCSLLKLPACGHSPQRDQPEAVIAAVVRWLKAPKSA